MKINFVPIDNRPITYDLASDIISIDNSVLINMPDISLMGGLIRGAKFDEIIYWLENAPLCELIVLSLDTVAYGGLVPSRRSGDTYFDIKKRLDKLKEILILKKRENKKLKIFAFSSIMRISNNNENEEEKEYWNRYGEKIFQYSYFFHKDNKEVKSDIPPEILEDYLKTRKRNFEINKIYLEWLKENVLDFLVYSKDDTGKFGLNVMEAEFFEKELKNLNGQVKTGADEIPLALLLRGIVRENIIKIFPLYREEKSKNLISKYEDISVENCVKNQIELAGLKIDAFRPDIILYVNNFKTAQGDLVFRDVVNKSSNHKLNFKAPFVIADINNSNGADENLVEEILSSKINPDFIGYSGYNTSANTIGSALCIGVVSFLSKKTGTFNEQKFKKLAAIRFLDDWAYQNKLRENLSGKYDDEKFENLDFKPFEEKIKNCLDIDFEAKYYSPWKRSFEIGINLCLKDK